MLVRHGDSRCALYLGLALQIVHIFCHFRILKLKQPKMQPVDRQRLKRPQPVFRPKNESSQGRLRNALSSNRRYLEPL